MLHNKTKQVKIVDCNNSIECEELVNRFLFEYRNNNPVLERDTTRPFLFYVYYEVTTKIPEDLRDEYSLRGELGECGDCPYFVVPDDKRMSARCALHHWRVSDKDSMCNEYLKELEAMRKGVE